MKVALNNITALCAFFTFSLFFLQILSLLRSLSAGYISGVLCIIYRIIQVKGQMSIVNLFTIHLFTK
jgi:hypothetical protein